MTFVHQALAWGFLLALVPLLIHLINMMRHRRVKWAAMEFLLQSYKKHRKWIWLKQLILLLMRMAAVALLVAMLAQWITRGQWLDLMGNTTTHHYVLLDDSYSMADRVGGSTAFETAVKVVQRIASNASQQDTRQRFTLIRFSRAQAAENEAMSGRTEQLTDINAEIVGPEFDLRLESAKAQLDLTQLPVGPRSALQMAAQLIAKGGEEHRVVYVVSDFRNKEWGNPAEMRSALSELEQAKAEIRMISCVSEQRPNLGIVDIQPTDETRAAGVPLFVNVKIRNHGAEAATKVQVKMQSVFHDPDKVTAGSAQELFGEWEELPTILIDRIAPGETVTRRAQVYFPKPGQHVVVAELPEDPVATDNRRWTVVDFTEGESVLIVHGTGSDQHAYYLNSVFRPGPGANTGILPTIQQPQFLRDSKLEQLAAFSAIYLLDVQQLDSGTVDTLEAYVRGGGGLAIFMGDRTNYKRYNERLYRDGEGLLPLPLASDGLLTAPLEESAADIHVGDHPIFDAFQGERNPLIRRVTIERYVTAQAGWLPDPESGVRVIAKLHNNDPLAVEKQMGEGRVITFLTSVAPEWNNWAPDPSFVVMLLKLQSYLAAPQRLDDERLVARPLELQLDSKKYVKDVTFMTPGENDADRVEIERVATKPQPDSLVLQTSLDFSPATGTSETDRSGVYEAVLSTTDGRLEVRRFAANVESNEGDLALADPQILLDKLDLAKVEFRLADEFQYGQVDQAGQNRSLMLMALLILLLLGEQLLAYSASYHPVRGATR